MIDYEGLSVKKFTDGYGWPLVIGEVQKCLGYLMVFCPPKPWTIVTLCIKGEYPQCGQAFSDWGENIV